MQGGDEERRDKENIQVAGMADDMKKRNKEQMYREDLKAPCKTYRGWIGFVRFF